MEDFINKMVETAQKVSVSSNEYNDAVYTAGATTNCLYRDISLTRHSANRDSVGIDGYLWLPPTEDVKLTDVYLHQTEGYLQIKKIIRAKRLLTTNEVMFLKCEVSKQRQIS